MFAVGGLAAAWWVTRPSDVTVVRRMPIPEPAGCVRILPAGTVWLFDWREQYGDHDRDLGETQKNPDTV